MHNLVYKLVLYRNIGYDSILFRMADIFRDFESVRQLHANGGIKDSEIQKSSLRSRIFDEVHSLLGLATQYGFNGDLWKDYISYLLAMTQNPFTLVSEKRGRVEGSVNKLAMDDFRIFTKLMSFDFTPLEEELGINCFTVIKDYKSVDKNDSVYNKNVSIRIRELSDVISQTDDEVQFADAVLGFYEKYGVGIFGMNKAFRIESGMRHDRDISCDITDRDFLVPIMTTSDISFDDLVGYDRQKQELIKNTLAFIKGEPANNVLLYGDAGTGKSSCIKAVLNMFYEKGLRIIEVYKHDFRMLPEIISIIKGRNYRFIIYMDDLSFESMETEYKYLKAVIEGGMEVRPENVLIYATSNRRHLIHETFSDRGDAYGDDVHRNDTIAERMSLSARFGVTIGFFRPERQEYYKMVDKLSAEYGIKDHDREELYKKADVWALRHGGMSGRTAEQFIKSLDKEETV